MMEARAISVSRQGRIVLEHISLSMAAGEVLVLLGPNGAGKSTLLSVLSGTLTPSIGEVVFAGRRLSRWSQEELARFRAVLAQESSLNVDMKAIDVVLLGRYPHTRGRNGPVDREIARAALAATEGLHLAGRSYSQLSGGERARVQLARAFCQLVGPTGSAPRCLLLDEPTASLDPGQQQSALGVVRRLARQEKVMVCVVLHDLNLAAQYGDRIALLERGRLVACGTPEQVLTEQILEPVYGVKFRVMHHPVVNRPLIVTLTD